MLFRSGVYYFGREESLIHIAVRVVSGDFETTPVQDREAACIAGLRLVVELLLQCWVNMAIASRTLDMRAL